MNKERLLNVAKACRESPRPDKFTMQAFHLCGTPCCAFGHYAARRDLQQVFQLDTSKDGRCGIGKIRVGVWGATRDLKWVWDFYQSHFGITEDDAFLLFAAEGCGDARTPIEAAEYIERFVATHS